MKPRALFEVLAEIADDHERHNEPEPLIIPVLSDELESRRDLLAEVAEFLGGLLLDPTSGAYDAEIDAYDDAMLRGVVGSALTFDRPGVGGRTELSLSFGAGRLDVELRVR